MDSNHQSLNGLKDTPFILSPPELKDWRALQVFCFFRLGIACVFSILHTFKIGPTFLGQINSTYFMICAQAYLVFSLFNLWFAFIKKPAFDIQINAPIFFDILALVLIMHFSGGFWTGLGLLLVILVAAHSLLAPIIFALLSASIATCAILAEQIYAQMTHSLSAPMLSQAGILGLCLFATAFVCAQLKQRLYKMQKLAYVRGLRLTTALKLNTQVVAFMQEGVIVISDAKEIQLINSAALRLLAIHETQQPTKFLDLPIRFQQAFANWVKTHDDEVFQVHKDSSDIRLTGTQLSNEEYVIFIHDVRKESQKAQHMKLALLGSLAANIAHEIRNPLSTVSHAAQLLHESATLSEKDYKLATMIKDNSDRMNTVVKNVLNISKKQNSQPKMIEVSEFMATFLESFNPAGIPDMNLQVQPLPEKYFIHVDPSQLRQMLVNLCENGLRYSMRYCFEPKIKIDFHIDVNQQMIQIHIIDYGQGIAGRDTKHMFEPFYTTENHGSGLGLYISREMCQINGGDIHYQPTDHGGSDFYIQLPLISEERVHDSA